jgi:Tfp pilus assembly protein PilZ
MDEYTPRRRWPRQPVTLECHIEGVSDRASIRLSELSFGGGYVDTSADYSVGMPVRLAMVLDGGNQATVSGRVIYTHPRMGFGFAFDLEETPDPSRQWITEFLQRQGVAEA